jgi:hypothetical protein
MRISSLGLVLCLCLSVFAEGDFHAGFLFDDFKLTLTEGHRTEALGPLFYEQQSDLGLTWAVPPLFSHHIEPQIDALENNFLYPLLTYERFGKEYRWQLGQLFSFAGGRQPNDSEKSRFTIFPIYFQQRSSDTNDNYTALLPVYGHLNDRLMRDRIFFVMFPIYCETRKRDVVTDNYLFPFSHLRHGDGLSGWQLWPLVGAEHKVVTSKTNGFGDVETIAGHDRYFALWPIHSWQSNGIGTGNPETFRADLPLYSARRSPQRDATTVLWPFFTWIDDRTNHFHEWQGPWPFVVFARGEDRNISRVWPIFSHSQNKTTENDSYLWPLYQRKETHADPLEKTRKSVLFYAYSAVTEKNTQTGAEKKRVDMWPFFTWHREFDGNERLQIFAPLEPALPNNRGIERNWSPLWSLWRREHNAKTGATSQSLLWNFYRREVAPGSKKCSLLFGLFQYQFDGENKRLRLFYLPVAKTRQPAGQSGK